MGRGRRKEKRRREALGLRGRVTLGFALGAMLLSVCLAFLTYELARSFLVRQRESSLIRQAFVNARLARSALVATEPDIPELLSSLESPAGSHAVVAHRGSWFAASVVVGQDALPQSLRDAVDDGDAARQRFALDGVPQLGVGVPIPAAEGAYFEVFSLAVLGSTLDVLRNSLVAAAAATTVAGAAVGRWASGRLMKPLAEASEAAAAVASGRFDVRLDHGRDSDLAVLAKAFNGMTDALRERIQRDARFASAVSHELRSPLTTLVTSLGVLQARRAEMGERARTALDLLASDLGRFERMVQDLLEISRLDAGADHLVFEDVSIGEFVLQAVHHSSRSDLVVDVDDAALDLRVRADKRRLDRVIGNLVENADIHGGGALRVAVERAGDQARLAVEDAGPGVRSEERERVFERFVRGAAGDRSRGGEGSGLGLSLVAEHVRLHGGKVWVEPRRGGGARFVVDLPIAEEGEG